MPYKCKEKKKAYHKEYLKKWSLKNTKKLSEIKYKYMNSEKGFVKKCISSMFSPSRIKERGLIPISTKKEILNYFNQYINKWGRVCFYCFEPWTYKRKKYNVGEGRSFEKFKQNTKNFSIDRLDNSKTYSLSNIIFCCTDCNSSKNRISIKLIKRLNEIIKERGL
jgi:hypothetical protein